LFIKDFFQVALKMNFRNSKILVLLLITTLLLIHYYLKKISEKPTEVKQKISPDVVEKIKLFHKIFQNEKRVYSQNGEDGVILALLDFIKFKGPGFYVEFGTESCSECNTRNLRENHNWKGIIITL